MSPAGASNSRPSLFAFLKKSLRGLGPGLITGASDDDPSGIATYSQVGAQFGLQMLWVMLFTFPLMSAVQQISARIGRVTGHGISYALCRHTSSWIWAPLIFLLFAANTVNIGADLGAMGDSLRLLMGGRREFWILAVGLLSIVTEVLIPYHLFVKFLKWSTVALFAYVATAFVVKCPWRSAFYHTVWPHISLTPGFLTALTAILGTTLSPYLLFWQASEEVDELELHSEQGPLKRRPKEADQELSRIAADTNIGMIFSNAIAWFVVLTAAAVLHASGHTNIQTSEQAAQALTPLAGRFSTLLFAMGIVGTGFLAIPVLAGSAAFAMGEAFRWTVGLERRPREAKGFYAVLALATTVGLVLNALQLNPITALIWAAVLNAIAMGPVLIAIMLLSSNRQIMGRLTLPPLLKGLGWLTTAVMVLSVLGWGWITLRPTSPHA